MNIEYIFLTAIALIVAGVFSMRQTKKLIDEMEYLPPESPVEPKSAPVEPLPAKPKTMNQERLDTLCTAIRDFEGKPGDQNYRYNNPGNFRYSPVGYLIKYGNVKKSKNGFAIFPTYQLGWEYMQASIKNWVKKYPHWTFRDLIHHYAPPSDNNPTEAYAKNIAKKCGVTVGTLLKDYLYS